VSDPRFVFILGTGRSGSSLVHELLARHDDVGFVSNIDDRLAVLPLRGRFNATIYQRVPERLTRKGRVRFAPSEGYRTLARAVSPMLSDPFRDLTAADVTPWLSQRCEEFFSSRAARQTKSVFIHKFTGWPRAGFLDAIFPDCFFVNVVRDGRAVANSWVQMPWWLGHLGPSQWHFGPLSPEEEQLWDADARSFVLLSGLAWRKLIDCYDEVSSGIDSSRWLNVRYEDFVRNPAQELKAILDHVGLPWNKSFEEAVGRHPFSTARSESFRQDLTGSQVDALNGALSARLLRHGYAL
jgi:hypothetical protein